MSRRKGASYERKIADILRKRFPQFAEAIRRSIQSRQAEESDVTGIPGLWLELQHAARPTPTVKLAQAIRDAPVDMIPVAITHQTGCKGDDVFMRMRDLLCLQGQCHPTAWRWVLKNESRVLEEPFANSMVQISFEDFLLLIERSEPWLRS